MPTQSTLEPNTVYLTADTGDQPGTYHWGILLTPSTPFSPTYPRASTYYHATTRLPSPAQTFSPNRNATLPTNLSPSPLDGPWRLDIQTPLNPLNPLSSDRLVSVYRIGEVDIMDIDSVEEIVRSVPADGKPSRRTGQSFNSRIWWGDVLFKLGEEGILRLEKSIVEIEVDCIYYAKLVEVDVIEGKREALIVNDTGASNS